MKKNIAILVLIFICSSCKSYLDYGKNIDSDDMDFYYFKEYNELTYTSRVHASADTEIYYRNHFSIKIPKKIKNWLISTNSFYFEYDNKEIIFIENEYKNIGVLASFWTLQDANKDEVIYYLNYYYNKRKYNIDDITIKKSGRVSKIYSNGRISILLYNIKKRNFDKYFNLVKSFKIIEYKE